jgi:hypothetical protein
MAKYRTAGTPRLKDFFPRIEAITVYAITVERMTGKEQAFPPDLRTMARERQDKESECAAINEEASHVKFLKICARCGVDGLHRD